MTPEAWQRVTDLFGELLSAGSDRQRAALLAGAPDPLIAREAAALWDTHCLGDGPLDRPISAEDGTHLIQGIVAPRPALRAGDAVGGFRIVGELGRGTFATVYLAEELSLGRQVALKVTKDPGREARTMAVLDHDHIVRVFSEFADSGTGARSISMQLIHGASLRAVLDELAAEGVPARTGHEFLEALDRATVLKAPFDAGKARARERLESLPLPRVVARLGLALAGALEHAHANGVLHLDIKPENILIDQYGQPRLVDFNVSMATDASGGHVRGGTPAYMPPEQFEMLVPGGGGPDRRIGPPADVFALGRVLRETLAGAATAIPPDLAVILDRCEAEEPAARYATAAALGQDLADWQRRAEIMDRLPPLGPIAGLSDGGLFLPLAAFVVVPQLIGSAVNILYNSTRIVSNLTAQQTHLFHLALPVFNPVIYGLLMTVYCWYVAPLLGHFGWWTARKARPSPAAADAAADLRDRLLRLPSYTGVVVTCGWASGAVFFPALLHLAGDPLPPAVWGHFGLSFLFSWLVANTYAVLFVRWLVLRVLYPKVMCAADLADSAFQARLRDVGRRTQLLGPLAGLIPILAAAMLILTAGQEGGPGGADTGDFHWLLIGLLLSGTAGFVIVTRMLTALDQAIVIWRGSADT